MGNQSKPIIGLIVGLLFMVIGITLALTVVDTAATTGADTQMGSFASAKSMNDLTPLIYYIGIILGGLAIATTSVIAGIRQIKGG